MSLKNKAPQLNKETSDIKSAQYVRGIGPKRFEALKRLGVESIRDLCYFFPARYEDRATIQKISAIEPDTEVTIQGKILSLDLRPVKKFTILEGLISDETETITAVWFNQPYLKNQLHEDDTVILSGRVEHFRDRIQLNVSEYEVANSNSNPTHVGRIIPIYPLTEGLLQRSLRQAMKEIVERHVSNEIVDFLPLEFKKAHHFPTLHEAVRCMHFPPDWPSLEHARRRIVYDEFLIFELLLLSSMTATQKKERGISLTLDPDLIAQFNSFLPFQLTSDQKNAITEISKDLTCERPMNRLLQGEVGTGKTVVAAFLLALTARSGYQAVFLAPTEILAEQHASRLKPLFDSLQIKNFILTGSAEDKQRMLVQTEAAKGTPGVFIGTHALLQDEIDFLRTGLVVIDEQHRFGVDQRTKLVSKNPRPHLLVMTATPIPRTLGLTLYGNFALTVVREQPKGRKPIKTFWIKREREEEVLEHIHKIISTEDAQAYILVPLIEESEFLDVQAATQEYEILTKGIFKNIPIGLLHGRLPKKEQEAVMSSFQEGKLKVLVTTSLIEVGVDNPKVAFMVIQNAERFGLSQLHQMRGRVGRGERESMCFLFGEPTSEEAKKRLRILTKTNDGFQIAEEDLILRGPGDFFGTRQSGLSLFKVANLAKDTDLLLIAREDAGQILEHDPNLIKPDHELLREEMKLRGHKVEL